MNFSYETWGSGEIVVQALRAVAVIAASDELAGAMLAAALLGLLIMATSAAFNFSMDVVLGPVKLVLVIALCGGVLLIPTTVTVTDRFDGQDLLWPGGRSPSGPVVITGVPFGIALPAALAATIGSTMTRVLETALQVVDAEDRLSAAGLWLSARALRAMVRSDGVRDSTLVGDFRYFLENCTYFDALAARISLGDLRTEAPLAELARTSGGLTSVHTSADGNLVPVSCDVAWHGQADGDGVIIGLAERITTEALARKFAACQSLRGIALAMDEAALVAARRAARTPTVGSAAACGDNVFEHAMQVFGLQGSVTDQFSELVAIGLLREGAHVLSSQDPRTLAFARFTAQRQRNATHVIAGELAAVALPALRGLLEVVVLILLPMVLVVGLLFFEQFARYLKNGLALVLWLQLWPPVMTILNSVGQWVQVAAMHKHVILGDGEFTLAVVEGALADLDTQLALSRYMLVLVPMLAWALVRAGEFSGAMLAGRLLQPGEQAAGAVAGNAATNNWTVDQVQMAPRTAVGPHIASVGDPWGGTTTRYERTATMAMPSNEPGYVAATQSRTVTEALSRRAEQVRQTAQEHRTQLASSVENAYESAYGSQGLETLSVLREQGVTDSTALRALQGTGETLRQAVTKNRTVEQHSGTEQTWRTGFAGNVGSNFLSLPASFSLELDTTQRQETGLSEQLRRSYDKLSETSKSALQEVGTAIQRSDRAAASTTYSTVSSDAHRATMREARSDLESYQETEHQANRLQRASEYSHTIGQSVVHALLKDPHSAGLLAELHHLQQAEGMPFEQAWPLAQQRTGTSLDLDAIATRLLQNAPAPMPESVRSPDDALETRTTNKARVDANKPEQPQDPAELGAADRQLQNAQSRAQESELPPTGEDFYQDNRAYDRTIRGPDGEIMVIPGKSLYREGDQRLTESFKDAIGWDADEDEPQEQTETSTAKEKPPYP